MIKIHKFIVVKIPQNDSFIQRQVITRIQSNYVSHKRNNIRSIDTSLDLGLRVNGALEWNFRQYRHFRHRVHFFARHNLFFDSLIRREGTVVRHTQRRTIFLKLKSSFRFPRKKSNFSFSRLVYDITVISAKGHDKVH